MGVRLIREASDTPNVSNLDDVRMIRYAYGHQDGILKNVGEQAISSVSGNIFKIGAGVLVLQGWEVEIDANGWSLTVDDVATKRYYAVYLEINLAAQTVAIKSVCDSTQTPTVQAGDDLSAYTTGTARLLLYTFSATGSVISSVVRAAAIIDSWTGGGFAKEKDLREGVYSVAKSSWASQADYASSAGSANSAKSAKTAALLNATTTPTYATISSGKASFSANEGLYFYNIVLVISSERVSFSGIVKIGPYLKMGYDITLARIAMPLPYNGTNYGTNYGVFKANGDGTVDFSLKQFYSSNETILSLNGIIELTKFAEKNYV